MDGPLVSRYLTLFTSAVLVLFIVNRADAAQLKLLVGGAVTESVRKIGAEFSRKTSHQIDLTTNTSGALQKMLRSGNKADIIIVASSAMDALEKEHLVIPGTRFDVARGLVGVGVRAGAAPPDLSSADAFKKAVLAARSVSYVDPKAGGTSGTYIAGLFQRLGIAAEMQKKTVFRNQGSEVADAVAKGEAEIGITFTSEMATNKGVKLAGFLPDSIQLPTNYSVAIPVGAPNADAARAFLNELKTPLAQAAFKEAGLEPIKNRERR
ncbi:MAG: molybdate ABC transporter substrate-binding protein [Acidobacteria bacterium]|nr:MAG: molybdate ABC transporter substrate-binding protein [Acidobacteriota bacterium]